MVLPDASPAHLPLRYQFLHPHYVESLVEPKVASAPPCDASDVDYQPAMPDISAAKTTDGSATNSTVRWQLSTTVSPGLDCGGS